MSAPHATLPAGGPASRTTALIGEIVVDLGFAERATVDRAVAAGREKGRHTGEMLVEMGAITNDQLAEVLALRFGVDHVHLTNFPVDMSAANLVNPAVAKRLEAVPVGFIGNATLVVAMRDPANVVAIDDIAMLTGYNVRPAVATPEDIHALVARLNRFDDTVEEEPEEAPDGPGIEDLREEAGDAPVVKLINSLIAQAVELGASDVHFEPRDGGLDVRMRVDGVMVDSTQVPARMSAGVVSRLKIMGSLDIAERRRPQDGRIGLTVDGRRVDIRAVVLPLVAGESVVLRVLDQGSVPLGLEELGLDESDRARLDEALHRSHGGVLTTGPTGSGKSTTLYAALMAINDRERTIVTIEDPVEYRLEGIKQIQVNEKVGVTFASGLRSIMRADPDTIMVGEIRDAESAKIAVEAAITGHLVLSTLHTNDAPTAMARLVEMGIEPYLVASSIGAVVGQRLVRRLCESCSRPVKIPAAALEAGADGEVEVREAGGCQRCGNTGYRGRIGLYEVMEVTAAVRHAVLERAPADVIAEVATSEGMRRLRDDGMAKVTAGITSLAEVTRVTRR
ncbi:MAG: Flp pilus assembly complex ATPase component TadA [Actinomycetota bacterium]|nr:Flp pilus assembly complex ATPase component TadA [Actinomycetota bacterium]